jgi:hypothetical protein
MSTTSILGLACGSGLEETKLFLRVILVSSKPAPDMVAESLESSCNRQPGCYTSKFNEKDDQ